MDAKSFVLLTPRNGARVWTIHPYGFVAVWSHPQSDGTVYNEMTIVLDGIVNDEIVSAIRAEAEAQIAPTLEGRTGVAIRHVGRVDHHGD